MDDLLAASEQRATPDAIVQCSNDIAARALQRLPSNSGRQNEDGQLRKISDTIARLAAFQARTTPHAGDVDAAGRLSTLTGFGSNPGALTAKFHLPHDLPNGAPLVVVLHGCTQTAEGYDYHSGWSRLANDAGFALLYPQQQRSNNPNLCFNWFQPADVSRDCGEALSIRQMIDTMARLHGLDRKRIFITGLSAGGAMASAMLASYPEVFCGGAIIAGLAFGTAATVPEAFDRMRGHGGPSPEMLRRMLRDASAHRGPWPRISIWHGTGDNTVAASNAQAIANQWWGVHQIESVPTHSRTDGNRARQVWCDDSGEQVMEINLIAGMGHGTPIDKHQLGTPGPYMLDVGVSSTQEIAQFWGIAQAGAMAAPNPRRSAGPAVASPVDPQSMAATEPATRLRKPSASEQHGSEAAPAASGVQKVIEDALRAAGLMR